MDIRRILLATLMMLGWTIDAPAGPVTFDFIATVDSIDSTLASFFTMGETLTGSYTFESTTPGVPFAVSELRYPALTAFSVKGSNFTGTWTGTNIFVQDSVPDLYLVQGTAGFSGTNTGVGITSPAAFIMLTDSTGALFNSTLLPLTPPGLPNPDSHLDIDYNLGLDAHAHVLATLESLTLAPTPAPEPAMLGLLAIALCSIALASRRMGLRPPRGRSPAANQKR